MPDPKHHYIPIFYLKQWCGADGRLCEYSRPYDTVKAQRCYPSETAFERGLYTMNAFPPDVANIVEKRLMGGTDNHAALALQRLVVSDLDGLDDLMRRAWTCFIISLWRRTPEALQQMEAGLRKSFAENDVDLEMTGDPDTDRDRLAEFQKHQAQLLQNLVLSPRVGKPIFDMRWSVVRFSNTRHTLLTSDRPFVMTNGIGRLDSHIAIPISPVRCFLAAASVETERRIQSMSAARLSDVLNDRVVRQSRKAGFRRG